MIEIGAGLDEKRQMRGSHRGFAARGIIASNIDDGGDNTNDGDDIAGRRAHKAAAHSRRPRR